MFAPLAAKLPAAAAAANSCAPGLPASFCHHHSTTSCVGANKLFCFGWAEDNFHLYVAPLLKHLLLVSVSVSAGFAIAFALAVLSHRRRWLVAPLGVTTTLLYTVPSIAFFSLLLPITGLGTLTGLIALTAYTLQILYRNINAGLANVPAEAKDAGRGMGMSDRQLLWRVELPLAVPEIIAGLRIATVSTVAIASLAFYAGAGGLGEPLVKQLNFKTNILMVFGLVIAMAIVFDLALLLLKRLTTPWERVGAR
jgi:osmoprotectant transport system permease protein